MTEETSGKSVQEKKEDNMPYCPMCEPMGIECKGRTTSDWDYTEEKETRDTPN